MMIQPVSSPNAFDYTAPQKVGAVQNAAAQYAQAAPEAQGKTASREIGPIVGKDALKRLDQAECETCRERRYQDGSDDPSVSFQTPQNIAPEASASIVRSHEQEHVSNEQDEADREGRKIVAQTVQLYTSVCPECGKAYVSGGKTTTLSKADNSANNNDNSLQTPYNSLAVDERT